MTIQWFGQSFFKVISKNNKGEDVVLAIDPYNKKYGLNVPSKFGADILMVTHDHEDHANVEGVKGIESARPFEITGPGEYEVKGAMIYGIHSFHDNNQGADRGENTIFIFEIEGIWVGHLGDLGQKELTVEQMEKLQNIDILLIPVGGKYTVDGKEASTLVSQIEPRIVIPMHYQIDGLKMDIENEDKFVKECGLKPEKTDKFKIQKKNLPQEETELVILEPKQ
jgi:L-ascorbate metabolism protein UlaG (beta-lactamase superfamily)